MDSSSPGAFVLRHKRDTELPEGAVLLSESDAFKRQWGTVNSWKSNTEVWPIKYGYIICGAAAALTGTFLTNFYRRKLKLVNSGFLSSHLPNFVLPGVLGGALHFKYVSSDILLTKTPCPLCVEVRSSVIQAVFGLIYPMALAPIVSFSYANLYKTYPMPSLLNARREVFGVWKKLTQPAVPVLKALFCLHVLLAIGTTYLEGTSYQRMCAKLADQSVWDELELMKLEYR